MITEDYVSFVTAKLLNEKGFDGFCTRYYQSDKEDVNGEHALFMFASDLKSFCTVTNDLLNKYANKSCENFSAPTLQMAMKWMRKKHNLCIEPYRTACGYLYTISRIPSGSEIYSDEYNGDDCASGDWTTWEKAIEAAIKHCLKNLI